MWWTSGNQPVPQAGRPGLFGWKMVVEDDVAIRLLEYKIACEAAADPDGDHEEKFVRAELSSLLQGAKLASAFAFVDKAAKWRMEHLMQAILLVEESGAAFQTILNREKAYVKLAKYIASVGTEVTHADLLEALPFSRRQCCTQRDDDTGYRLGLQEAHHHQEVLH